MALRIRCRLAYLAPFACGKAQYATLGETLYESGAVLAMRQKPFDRTPSVLARLLARLGVSVDDAPHAAEVEAREPVIPEDILVALSTIQHCYPDWLEDEELFEDFAGYLKRQKVALPEHLKDYLDDLRKSHLFGQYCDVFMNLSAGIRVL